MIYPNFGTHPSEHLIFGIQQGSMIINKNFLLDFLINYYRSLSGK